MDAHPTLPALRAPSASPGGDHAAERARIRQQLAILDRLTEFGAQMCEAMALQLKATSGAPFAAPPPKLFHGDFALSYSRVSRAVRLAIMLQIKLAKALTALSRGDAAPAPTTEPESDPAPAPDTDPRERRERVETERFAAERETPDDIHALLDRPVDEVIGLICQDLGLDPAFVLQIKTPYPYPEVELDDFGEPLTGRAPRPGERPAPRPRPPPGRWPRSGPS